MLPPKLSPFRRLLALFPILFCISSQLSASESAPSFPVDITIDCNNTGADLPAIWRFFGADEPNYATMKDGKRLLSELGALAPGNIYFRAHNLLSTGDGTPALKWGSTNAYTEDKDGNPVYDWTILDHIFDTYLARGVRPYAQVGFMPEALSIHPQPYQHEWRPGLPYDTIGTGWSYPPKDYSRWAELTYQWVKHCVERYGRAEVEKWYWEVWNEPNGPAYWHATPAEFYKLHDFAIDAIKRALPTARVGGPEVAGAGGSFMEGFLEHCAKGVNFATGQRGTPTDFLAFHAKGWPTFVDGHVRLGIANHLREIDKGFALISASPELRNKPIVIGESDPDGCAACQGAQLGYRTGTLYSSYTAASFARKYTLAEKHQVNLEGALTWAFEFEDQPYFAGQRVLMSNGIDLPVINVFRMFSKMSGKRLGVSSTSEVPLKKILESGVGQSPDVSSLATLSENQLSVLVWHYHDENLPGPSASVKVVIDHVPAAIQEGQVKLFLIDEAHSNSFSEWVAQGSPSAPTATQYERLKTAGALTEAPENSYLITKNKDRIEISVNLERRAVGLFAIGVQRQK